MSSTLPSPPGPFPGPDPATDKERVSQRADADGRVSLAEGVTLDDPRFANGDLLPVPTERRTWGVYNYTALWIGMAHNIPSWTLASGLVALGMDWKQAVLVIGLANVIVLLPMLLTGHAGPKYGGTRAAGTGVPWSRSASAVCWPWAVRTPHPARAPSRRTA